LAFHPAGLASLAPAGRVFRFLYQQDGLKRALKAARCGARKRLRELEAKEMA
jgi:hypothetical protein